MAATAIIMGGTPKGPPLGLIKYLVATSTIGAVYEGWSYISKCSNTEKIFTDRMAQKMFEGAIWGPITVPTVVAAAPIIFMAKLFE